MNVRLYGLVLLSASGCFVVDGAVSSGFYEAEEAGTPFDPIADWYPDVGCTGSSCARIPVELAVGDGHTCARMGDGTVRCWGDDAHHQLGSSSLEAAVPTLAGVKHLAAGAAHTCALLHGGQVQCWGQNDQDQTGTLQAPDAAERPDVTTPQTMTAFGTTRVSAIAAAAAVTCVIQEGDQQASDCVGSGFAEIGRQGADQASGPARHGARVGVNNVGILATALSARRVVLVDRAGRAADANSGPNLVREAEGVVGAAVGWNDGLLLLQDGTVRVFGSFAPCDPNEARDGLPLPGETAPCTPLADPPPASRRLGGARDVAQVAMSTSPYDGQYAGFACLRGRDGTVSCWGHDGRGQLGRGATSETARPELAPVVGLAGVTQLALGFAHACALTRAGRVFCWGDDRVRQLGSAGVRSDAEADDAYAPAPVEIHFR